MAYNFGNLTVLVVESNNAMFDLTKGVLDRFGVGRVISAYDSDTGFKRFCTTQPDLVIVDWLREKPNGVDLTRMIRTSAKSPNPFVPIIMMTGYNQKQRVLMARDSGITEFVVKPFTARALYEKIEAIIENPRQFVKSPSFFGPDRRRRAALEYGGPDRRKGEEAAKAVADGEKASERAKEIHKRRYE